MKTIPIALAAHYATPWHTLCACLKVTRRDAVVLGFTSYSRAIEVDGLAYLPGFDLSSLASTDSIAVDNLELTILPDDSLPASDLLAGRWDNAAFEVFECNYRAPADGINTLKRGTMGDVQLRRGSFVVEFRSLAQSLQQTQGIVSNKTCRARLGDAKCTKNLTAFTYTGAATAVASRLAFTDSSRAEAADWFAEGVIQFTSGANLGFRQKVKAFAAGGAFTLALALPFDLEVGDTYSVIAGCRKRLAEDCRDKFDNVLNFQGEPHLPGLDAISKPASAGASASAAPPDMPGGDTGDTTGAGP